MPNPDNEPQLPKNQSPIIDDRTGLVSRDWYRFFLNLLNRTSSGAGTVTSVNVSGGATGLTTSGGPVTTSGTITLAGTLDVNNGGTGATTASGARANLGAAASGANSDITSMSGITGGISSPDFIQFDTTATVTDATGRLYYDDADQFQTLTFQMNGGTIQRIGEELYYRVKLSAAATKGQVLMFSGTLGASGGLQAAPATGLLPEQANYILGIAHESGITNDWVFVTSFGEVKNIDTTGGAETWVQGDVLYYNPLVTGGLTKFKPTTPAAIAVVAAVVNVGVANGILFVRPTYGSVLGGTDGNVNITSLASGNTLIYDAVAGVWENANLTDGTAISITEGPGSITITNTAPDQVVSITGAGTTSVSGTYPNFTVTSNDQYVGTVTSVAGTGTVNGISLSGTVTSSGSLTLGGTLSNVSLTTQVTGTLPIANGGTGQTTKTAAFDALSPVTTKGDLIVSDGTDNVRLPVGTDNYVLTADSAQATGVKWALSTGSGATITNDTATSTNLYPTFAAATSGALANIYTSNAKYLYKPSTGELTSEHFVAGNGIFVNSLTIDVSYTIAAGTSGMSAGPITVASGTTVTVSSGSRWVVV